MKMPDQLAVFLENFLKIFIRFKHRLGIQMKSESFVSDSLNQLNTLFTRCNKIAFLDA